jgi:hypothetical protein
MYLVPTKTGTEAEKDEIENNMPLTQTTIIKAFQYIKTHKEDFIQAMKNIKPGPEHPPPTTENYQKWTLSEWAGYLQTYIKPKHQPKTPTTPAESGTKGPT